VQLLAGIVGSGTVNLRHSIDIMLERSRFEQFCSPEVAAELQRKGFVVRHNYVGSGQGSVCRVVEFAPGGAKFMHRTETLDYAICLKGECDLELDDGRTVPMKAGDICVQRGTMHAWVAKGSEPAVFAFVLIDAEPVEKGGKKLTTHYPTR